MLGEVATYVLVAAMTAFAVSAVLLNEGEHAQRRRRRRARRRAAAAGLDTSSEADPDPLAAEEPARDPAERRLPVGDFLFGALSVRGEEPFPFAELAEVAANSGLSVAQVLGWLEQAEQSGIVERVPADDAESSHGEPAVRLTTAGMDIARNNRRSARKAARRGGFVTKR